MAKTQKIKFLISFAFVAIVFVAFPAVASAATLYFSPSSESHAVGTTFSVSIYVSSPDQTMNAVSGVVSFPTDKLSVESLSKNGSIFGLWVQDPSFSNSAGTINFEGIVLNPGFIGSGGKIITITFKTKSSGNASLTFSSASVLANDGKGTSILSGAGSASFAINVPTTDLQAPEATTPAVTTGIPLAPVISSPTHPDPDKWYSNSNPKFNWNIPNGVTAVRLLYDTYPTTKPTVTYSSPIQEKVLEGIDDGIYYFHVQFKSAAGWGAVSHFRFQIDTKSPEPFEVMLDGNSTVGVRPTVLFSTTDVLSGIDYYEIKIGEGDYNILKSDEVEHNPYTLPPQTPGKKIVIVKAFDKAGNFTTVANEITMEGIDMPVVTDYPKELAPGQFLSIKGVTYPNIRLSVWIKEKDGQPNRYTTYSEESGSFSYVFPDKFETGTYDFWLVAVNNDDVFSEPTNKYTVVIKTSPVKGFISMLTGWFSILVPFTVLIIVFVLILLYGWHTIVLFRKKLKNLRKEVHEAELVLHKAFDMLKEDIRDQVKILEKTKTKRQLTIEEKKIIKQFRKDLDNAETFVTKEIKNIEKEIR